MAVLFFVSLFGWTIQVSALHVGSVVGAFFLVNLVVGAWALVPMIVAHVFVVPAPSPACRPTWGSPGLAALKCGRVTRIPPTD